MTEVKPVSGFLNILKPPGMSSHDVVGYVRRVLHTKKVGHAGTLDPAAAGVLPVAVGTATFTDPGAAAAVCDGIAAYCAQHGFAAARELTGALEA